MKRLAFAIALTFVLAGTSIAQRLALLEPATDGSIPQITETLKAELAKRTKLIDGDLAAAAYRSLEVADPFNMSADEARRVGSVIGCDRFLLLRSALQRRTESGERFYIEAYAITYVVDTRTGLLIDWHITNSKAQTQDEAIALLLVKMPGLAATVSGTKVGPAIDSSRFPAPPSENSPEAANLKLPVPYKRIPPEYTETASLYGVKATVDIELDIDAEGRVGASQIVRWAGFGLDQSVEKAVRSMNWRPAMRNGKPLSMRVLLRYNFRKVEKDAEN